MLQEQLLVCPNRFIGVLREATIIENDTILKDLDHGGSFKLLRLYEQFGHLLGAVSSKSGEKTRLGTQGQLSGMKRGLGIAKGRGFGLLSDQ